ncbi:YihY/virulence factor BrkB family protein [Anaeromyxobacter oryzisoli]|uniref:YihY/virulence factor BrkB family protein n=1 Tax=Anaeromyxobacter oryzisoli TaxID=2925408 RepID=UPI001F5ACBAC|nr:YihY/virulence factor BrkB family protein [Anaeromyxobacter sp. SG63]
MDPVRNTSEWATRLLRFTGRALRAFSRNRGVLLAGGVGYNALLSLVPFLTLAVATLSIVFDEARILDTLRPELTALVPQHADAILEAAQAFLHTEASTRVLSVVSMLFFSSIAFRMLEQAVAAIFHTSARTAHRSFWVSALLPYLFMLVLMVALLGITLLTAGLDALDEHQLRLFGLQRPLASGIKLLLRLSGFLGLVVLFAGIYRVLPVIKISGRRALVGGLAAAALWRLTALFMVYFFANISTVNVLYGSLATVVVVLLSLEIVFVILLLGAQVIAELEASAAAGVHWYEKPRETTGTEPEARVDESR